MNTDADLETLIRRKDHLNVLRYLRVHQLRHPKVVVTHARAFLGHDLRRGAALETLAALEQLCIASLDLNDHDTAQLALDRLVDAGVSRDSARFRRLLALCLHAARDVEGAQRIYQDLLQENPSNLTALQGKYLLHKGQVGHEQEAAQALNDVLQQDPSHLATWFELAQLKMRMGDYKAAAFSLEEILIHTPTDPFIHTLLAECYTTVTGEPHLLSLARKHFCQALELNPEYRRAQWGLLLAANRSAATLTKDEHDVQVAQALQHHSAEALQTTYRGSALTNAVQSFTHAFTS